MSEATSSNVGHHKVFINFRGKELRGRFVSHLERALMNEGVNVFTDNHERMGKDLEIFFKRIEESRIAIAVISSLYSESTWCLDELAKIKECVQRDTLEVFPVFYKVTVDTVKRRRGMFGDNFRDLAKRDHVKGRKWRKALKFVTKKKGETVEETSDEVLVIDKIVKDVKIMLKEISTNQGTNSLSEKHIELSKGKLGGEPESFSPNATPFFGIETRISQLKEKLYFKSDEVTRVVGVVGMPGIGKTTLARKLFDDWRCKFLHTMFLDDVRDKSKSLGFHRLQEDLLYGLKKSRRGGKEEKDSEFSLESLKAELSESKVLIVLDDVSEPSQIEKILGRREWLKEGSKVIITTSSMSAVKGMVDDSYLVPGLSDNDALKYFKNHAFSGSCEPRQFMMLAREIVDYCRGHPLALKVLGSELLRKDESYWTSKIVKLSKSPISSTIHNIFRIPYDDLSKQHKDLFLDVACFFRDEDEYHVRSLVDSSFHENVSEIRDLADNFLINICGGRLEMNDLMYTFAMGLLESQSSSKVPTSGRRLFNPGEIIDVLLKKSEATNVRGIFLDMSEVSEMSLGSDAFEEMNDLRYLKFYNSSCLKECDAHCNLNFPNGLKFTMQKIRYLHWLKFPQKKFPQDFNPKNLVDLKFPYSQIEQLWEGDKDTSKLKWLDLHYSSNLRTLSGLSLARKLQSINLEGCTKLKTVHQELQYMESLVFLNLKGCTSLESLRELKLISLKTLILSGCSNLEEFNLISETLEELYLDGTAIKELPSTIGNLQRLVFLILKDCKRLLSLPDSIGNLKALEKLVLSGCSSFTSFPEVKENMTHLKTLLLDGTAIKEMPHLLHRFSVNQGHTASLSHCYLHEICKLKSIQRLYLSRNNFRSLPSSITYLYNLIWLDLKHCEELVSLPKLPPNLHWLDAHGCISLENIESPLALILPATEHSHSTFIFTNCAKLDQAAKNVMVSYVRRKIQLMSDALTHQEKGSMLDVLIGICFPGWQLPVWFNHRSVGSQLRQKLPRHWDDDELTGIALCAVVSFENYRAQKDRILVRCTSEFKEENEPLIQFSCILGGWTERGSNRPREIIKSSGHVFIGYTSLVHIKKHDRETRCVATEASFKFVVTDGNKKIRNCEVLKCGFTLIYAPTKHVPSLCTQVHADVNQATNIGSSIEVKEIYNPIQSQLTSIPLVAPEMKSEITEEVTSLEVTREEVDIQSVAILPISNGEVHMECIVDDATPKIDDNIGGESMSPRSSEEGEVVDEEYPEEEETNQGDKTSSSVSLEGTETPGNDQSVPNGRNNLYEQMRKPLRLLRIVISIYAVAAFVMGKEKRKP